MILVSQQIEWFPEERFSRRRKVYRGGGHRAIDLLWLVRSFCAVTFSAKTKNINKKID